VNWSKVKKAGRVGWRRSISTCHIIKIANPAYKGKIEGIVNDMMDRRMCAQFAKNDEKRWFVQVK